MDNTPGTTSGPYSLLQSIQHQVRPHRSGDTPADDVASENIDDESHVREAAPGRHVGDVSDPQLIRPISHKLALHQVHRPLCRCVRDRCPASPASPGTFETEALHQPLYSAAGHLDLLPV
jgi:hypothetical protein